jgi:hypothetical protein
MEPHGNVSVVGYLRELFISVNERVFFYGIGIDFYVDTNPMSDVFVAGVIIKNNLHVLLAV